MSQKFANNASSALAGSISNVATTLNISAGDGALFPSLTGSEFFYATLVEYNANGAEVDWEIVKVTAVSTDMFSITRAQEGTAARAWPSGTRIENRFTAGTAAAYALDADISLVGKTNSYNDLSNKPDLSVFDDIVLAANFAGLPAVGDANRVYIAKDTGYMYRWNGTAYTQLTDQTAIWGQVSGTLANQTDLQTVLNTKLEAVAWSIISSKPVTATRWPAWDEVTLKPITATRWPIWSEVTSKPDTAVRWPIWGEVTSKPATATRWPAWSEVTSKPATFAPSAHGHPLSEITGTDDLATKDYVNARPYTPYALTAVTTTLQTRTIDVANGPVQTIQANYDFSLNATGPAGKRAVLELYVYATTSLTISRATGAGGNMNYSWEGASTFNIAEIAGAGTFPISIIWDGYNAWPMMHGAAPGDQRPT